MAIEELIKHKLIQAFNPEYIEIINDSERHRNHAGSPRTLASHFYIKMVAAIFKDKSRIQRHRLVYEALEEELKSGIHALQLDLQ